MAEKKLDACARKVKARVKKWPSARASQQVAQCRKAKGQVRKSKEGSDLKRWGKEKWKDKRTGKPCGQGGKTEYCRPTKVVSKKKTPNTRATKKEVSTALARKRRGARAPTKRTPRRK